MRNYFEWQRWNLFLDLLKHSGNNVNNPETCFLLTRLIVIIDCLYLLDFFFSWLHSALFNPLMAMI